MAVALKLFCGVSLFVMVLAKRLHYKEDLEAKDKEAKSFMNLFNNEEIYVKNERYARHLPAVTENVLEHLLGEIKQQYFSTNYNSNSPIRRLIRNLNKELKRNEHDKMMKERLKKKVANKKRGKGKKGKRTTTEKYSDKQY